MEVAMDCEFAKEEANGADDTKGLEFNLDLEAEADFADAAWGNRSTLIEGDDEIEGDADADTDADTEPEGEGDGDADT